MKIFKKELEETDKITDVICDICGKSCKYSDSETSLEYASIEVNWGYYSHKDLTTWTAQICEKCVDEKLDNLIKFHKFNSMKKEPKQYKK